MSLPKYKYFSPIEVEHFVEKASSMEEVLECMQYTNARDSRFITAIRSYCKTLGIDTNHLPDCRDTIQCNSCGQHKTLDNFYFTKGKLGQKVCKDCVRQREKDKYHSKQSELNEFKQAHPCVKCGCSKFYLIDFHHLNPAEKDFTIGENPRVKMETLMKEIDKCVPLCANCHREFHYLEREQDMTIEEYINGVME